MNPSQFSDPYLPHEAEILECAEESATIFTLHIRFIEAKFRQHFLFHPGQFNMVYLYGVGEVAISIVSDPEETDVIKHTIRAVGRVTKALQKLKVGDRIGIRGPYGKGWPLAKVHGKDIIIVTGGLGCAPTVSIINYILARRESYKNLKILQGVKHSDDFIFRKQYAVWQKAKDTEVYIAADQVGANWHWAKGRVTNMIQSLELYPSQTIVMMCGPEVMMHSAISVFTQKGIAEEDIYLSMERNMECGIGHCGHCQYGGLFVCKDGPVFAYPKIKPLFNIAGF